MRALVLLAVLSSCGRLVHFVNKGPPQQVVMTSSESAPKLVFRATRRAQTVELAIKRQLDVAVTRTVRYGSSETYADSGSILWELLEIPFGLLLLPAAWLDFNAMVTQPAGQVDLASRPAFVLLNPFRRMLSTKSRGLIPTERIPFVDPPRHRAYTVKLPVEGVALSYKILDDAHAVIGQGAGRTDMFGTVSLGDVGEAAVAIEATADGATAVIAIE